MHPRAVDPQLCPDYLCPFISRAWVSLSVRWGSGRPGRSVARWVEGSVVRVPEGQPLFLQAFKAAVGGCEPQPRRKHRGSHGHPAGSLGAGGTWCPSSI